IVNALHLHLYFTSFYTYGNHRDLHSFPTRRSSDLVDEKLVEHSRRLGGLMLAEMERWEDEIPIVSDVRGKGLMIGMDLIVPRTRSEEHTSELQSLRHLVCRLLLEKKKKKEKQTTR